MANRYPTLQCVGIHGHRLIVSGGEQKKPLPRLWNAVIGGVQHLIRADDVVACFSQGFDQFNQKLCMLTKR
ncbi:hypothetical protein WK39_18320 [Burkholderia cepacia]|nr:hypothetical protein WK39_18320 [Burkholderia cepacia]KVS63558.1 hypothetical protein WK40_00340 [Burkholderia cepacia]